MNVNEKIKYFRKKKKITQEQLANLSDIHPVSIRKYETNKMQPQLTQIKKIADALEITPSALLGIDNNIFRLETKGDFVGLLMNLYNSRILLLKGTREADGKLNPNTLSISLNPLYHDYLAITENEKRISKPHICISDPEILENILCWDSICFRYQRYLESSNSENGDELNALQEEKDKLEVELQSSVEKLNK